MIAMVCYLKACKPDCLKPANGKMSYSNIIEAARLDEVGSYESYRSLQCINKLVRFDLADENTRQKCLKREKFKWTEWGAHPRT